MRALTIRVVLERKHPDLPAFVVVPGVKIARWKLGATTTVEAMLDRVPLGRRSLLRGDDELWFIELRREHLEALGKVPGDHATLVISLASTALPPELQALLDGVPAAAGRWRCLTDAQRRMLREEIVAAKTSATRDRRARRALLPVRKPAPPRVEGLTAQPRTILLRIVGRSLPGTTCDVYYDVTVGLAHKVGRDPADGVPADRRTVTWETHVEVREHNGAPAFRGPAVNGPPRERFLYLTWIGRKGRAGPAMFRRAKLRLDAIPADTLAGAMRSGVLVGKLGLTAPDGTPLCGSVRPPQISWSCPD